MAVDAAPEVGGFRLSHPTANFLLLKVATCNDCFILITGFTPSLVRADPILHAGQQTVLQLMYALFDDTELET